MHMNRSFRAALVTTSLVATSAHAQDMRLGNQRGGAGALFTTAADLVMWNDALAAGRLGKLMTEKIQEPATLSNGRKLTYARGLSLND